MSQFLCILTSSELLNYTIVDVLDEDPFLDNGNKLKEKFKDFGEVSIKYQSLFNGTKRFVKSRNHNDDPYMSNDWLFNGGEDFFVHNSLTPYKTNFSENVFKINLLETIKLLSSYFYENRIDYFKNNEETQKQIDSYIVLLEQTKKETEKYRIQHNRILEELNKYKVQINLFMVEEKKILDKFYLNNKSSFGLLGRLSGKNDQKWEYFQNIFLRDEFLKLKTKFSFIKVNCICCENKTELEYTFEIKTDSGNTPQYLKINSVIFKCQCKYQKQFTYRESGNNSIWINYYFPSKNEQSNFKFFFENELRNHLFYLLN
jgi:hypothetical protein